MGKQQPYSSLTSFSGSILVNLTIMGLIITGGLGFRTWEDIGNNRFRVHKYRLQTKLILFTTAVLIFLPAIGFFFIEFRGVPLKERILSSLFQSVTTRTAGFNTADFASFSDSGKLLSIILMLIGGSPGSTAGGMKTTTIAVLILNANGTTVSAMIISLVESLPLLTCMFETASAIGTVGLTLGITPGLGQVSRMILIFLMYFGRVGGLTLIYAAVPTRRMRNQRFPLENVSVG